MVGEEPHALHLVEDGIVAGVDLIPPVHVSGQQEGVQAGAHQLPLVGGSVGAQHGAPEAGGDGAVEPLYTRSSRSLPSTLTC